jgi:serine/threonine protein kinase
VNAIAPGDILEGRYVVEQLLGSGGSSEVYRARDSRLGKCVALKISDAGDGLLEREAHLLAALEHPAIVPATDFFEHGGWQCLVLQYVTGRDLQAVLDATIGYLAPLEVLHWADQMCDVLAYLHARQPAVLVRDLKPANVMLEPDGRIRLIDFGISRRLVPGCRTTAHVQGYGTDGFAPVEQYGGGATDARSDVYALGATLYALLTHVVPPVSVARLSGNAVLQPPSMLNPDIGIELEKILLRALEPRQRDRYQDVNDMRAELKRVMESLRRPSQPVPPPVAPALTPVIVIPAPFVASTTVQWAEPLRYRSPFTRVYCGQLDEARQVLARTLRSGLSARLLPEVEPSSELSWMVVVEHSP